MSETEIAISAAPSALSANESASSLVTAKSDFSTNSLELERVLHQSYAAHGLPNESVSLSLSRQKLPNVQNNWGENFFGFQNSRLWNQLQSDQKHQVLVSLNEDILTDIYFIETAGMKYAAKMNLMSEDLLERQFFCLMGAEEASHFHLLKPFFPKMIDLKSIPPAFAGFIHRIVEEGDRAAGLCLIQVLLEGWGLSYYQELTENALHDEIKLVFTEILRDESRHHAAGVLLHRRQAHLPLSSFIQDSLRQLMQFVQCGPAGACLRLLTTARRLDRVSCVATLRDLNAAEKTQEKLNRLRNLLAKVLRASDLEKMERLKMFSPLPEDQMAQVILNSAN